MAAFTPGQVVVTAEQMQAIEGRVFAAGMPVAALMEKVAGRITQRLLNLYPVAQWPQVGVLVGPGHNGGDALVVARELHLRGYQVAVYLPFSKLKDLTSRHATYVQSLGIPIHTTIAPLQPCDWFVDGLFGFGLERDIQDPIKADIDHLNQWPQPVVSIDLPSGLQTDTGKVMGTAIRATQTLCLGLWKQGLLQEYALEYVGTAELVEFDLPLADIQVVLGPKPAIQRITTATAIAQLPLPRPASTHKYQMGHLLLICGSRPYAGAAILSSLGARASGVGMVSIAVPESIKPLVLAQVPEALVVGCPETELGSISRLPDNLLLEKYDAVACGPGLSSEAGRVVQQLWESHCPLILDADGLNLLAQRNVLAILQQRSAPTVLTPHLGEFKRLFPDAMTNSPCRLSMVRQMAESTKAIILLKGARIIISNSQGQVWINPESTPALARGGTGDVLTGLLGGLMAQRLAATSGQIQAGMLEGAVIGAAWWHAQAGIQAVRERTELGVDAFTLSQYLIPTLANLSKTN